MLQVNVYIITRELSTRLPHETMKAVMRPLSKQELNGFLLKSQELVEWKCVPLLIHYCFDVLEDKGILVVRHRVAVMRPYIRRTVTRDDTVSGQMAFEKLLRDTNMNRIRNS